MRVNERERGIKNPCLGFLHAIDNVCEYFVNV